MNKEINYTGYSAVPSDYECPDGQLAASLNLIPEDGHLVSLSQPDAIMQLPDGFKLLVIHNTPLGKYAILANGATILSSPFSSPLNPKTIGNLPTPPNTVEILGNTLVFATDYGLRYVLFRDGEYVLLGERPPFIPISFSMHLVGSVEKSKKLHLTVDEKKYIEGGIFHYGEIEQTPENNNALYGLFLSAVSEKATEEKKFVYPCFVRYAFRLYDGTYLWHSAPVLMLPNTLVPGIAANDDPKQIDKDNGIFEFDCSVKIPLCELQYHIPYFPNADSIKRWESIITAIDIFISAPIYTFNQDADIYSALDYENPDRGGALLSYFFQAVSAILSGHRSFEDQPYNLSSHSFYLPRNKNFHSQIENVNAFYKIASIPFDQLKPTDDFKPLEIEDGALSSLLNRPTLPDEYRSHCSYASSILKTFNARLNFVPSSVTPPVPLPLEASADASRPDADYTLTITVYSIINGIRCSASLKRKAPWDIDAHFPRYYYYPEPGAYRVTFSWLDKSVSIPLKPHEHLNGAYFYSTHGVGGKPVSDDAESDDAESEKSLTSVSLHNKVYTSEANNPFLFPPTGINTLGDGVILGINTAARALSQGQFGQFPLYAFTSEGVWALESAANGSFTAKQPITRDVCINPASITQLDASVLFATDRGLMLISGSQTQCISDAINSETPFDVSLLPGMDKLHAMLGHAPDSCIPTVPFSQFLHECGMLYDYVHQRIIVYHPRMTYAYVFSIKSKEWGMMYSDILAGVNSYPDALAVDHNYNLVNFSLPPESSQKGLFVTRPLKLDAADALKTVDNVIQRGHFAKGHVQSVLYGSRDLLNWHLIWSSRDHYLRGFRGTPYKYFRIACVTDLALGESVSGASVQFTPRLLNQPR